MKEPDFKTDFERLDPIELTAEDVASPEPAGNSSADTAEASSPEPSEKPRANRRISLLALATLAAVGTITAGAWLYARPSQLASTTVESASPAEPTAGSERPPAVSVAASHSITVDDAPGWTAKLEEVDELRNLLQAKKREILRVQKDYRYGILELEEETKRLLKQWRIDSVDLARKNSEVELMLQNIQRRQVYSEALELPLQWIDSVSEELLYLKRRTSIDLLVASVAEGLDMQRQLADIDHALQAYQPTASRLSIDLRSVAAPSLGAVGKRLIEQARHMRVALGDDQSREIEAEICSGNMKRAGELSKLSLKGARCLAESDSKQLFLNRLTELSPPAAQKLSEWPGEWLCLNGLSKLDADVAAHLFSWQGPWLSLNGLSELSSESGKHVAGWNGRQLELIGLQKPLGMEYLVQWEAAGGRLFVPDALRRATVPVSGTAPEDSES